MSNINNDVAANLESEINDKTRTIDDLMRAKTIIESKIVNIQAELRTLYLQKCTVYGHEYIYYRDIFDSMSNEMICNNCGDVKNNN
jgi:hypothetical protein